MTELISFILGVAVGYMFLLVTMSKYIRTHTEQAQEVQMDTVPYSLEKHNKTYYAFELNDTFIAQGESFEDLSTNMQSRHPNTHFVLQSYTADISDDLISKILKHTTEHENAS